MSAPKGYSLTQIVLHWLVFVLVAHQFLQNEAISRAWWYYFRERAYNPSLPVYAHVAAGALILVLVFWRMAIKFRRGAPELPKNEPVILKFVAHAVHFGLYALLILMAVTGWVAWFGESFSAKDAHGMLKFFLLPLIALHVAGALFHQFVLKSDVMKRMGKPER